MHTNVKDHKFYKDMYDRHTVEWARRDMKYFLQFRDEWFKIMPEKLP